MVGPTLIIYVLGGMVLATVIVFALGARANGFIWLIDRLSAASGKLFAWCVVILTVVVCYEVFMRYALRRPTGWAYDAGYMLYGALFFMAGAYTLAHNAHVRADVIYRFMRPRVQAWLDIVLYLVFFFPAVIMIVYSGWGFAEVAWRMGERSAFSPAGPPVYHFKTLIPISGVFLFLQGLAELGRCITCIREGSWPRRLHDVEEIQELVIEGHIPESIEGQVPTEGGR